MKLLKKEVIYKRISSYTIEIFILELSQYGYKTRIKFLLPKDRVLNQKLKANE